MSVVDIAGAAAIILTFASFAPYIKGIRAGAVKPHFFSWLIWTLTTLIVFFAQLEAKGGVGAWSTGVSGAITLYVAWLAYSLRSDLSASAGDKACLGAALLSLPLWYLTDDPLWSVVILTTIDVIGFVPTLRKSLIKPQEESMTFYALFAARSGLSVFALEARTLTTVLFPAAMVVACLLVCGVLWWRRRAQVRPSR